MPDNLALMSASGPWSFDIKASRLPGGMVAFHVLVATSEKGGTLNYTAHQNIGAELRFITSYEHAGGSSFFAELPVRKGEKSLTCDFQVPEKFLDNPTLCFELAESFPPMADGDGQYFVLRDFYKPEVSDMNLAKPESLAVTVYGNDLVWLAYTGGAVGLVLFGFLLGRVRWRPIRRAL